MNCKYCGAPIGKDDLKDLNKMLKTVKVSNKNNSYDSGDDEFISFFDIN